MIAFAFRFPAGRYHATPWGRHANEADVAWPPEPARILRALIATWWRKADHARFPKALLDGLVDALAAEPPVFYLPDATQAHLRAYMPAPVDKKLIYDGFLRLGDEAEMVVAWPNAVLTTEQREFAVHLLERIGYLGRAESWVAARIADDWDGAFNASPRTAASGADEHVPVDLALPVPPQTWASTRAGLLERSRGMTKGRRAVLEATLPGRLSDALAVDTGQWQKAGWSSPPPLARIVYDRPSVGPLPRGPKPKVSVPRAQAGRREVARFVLAGRPLPRIEETLKIGEIARAALMAGGGDPPREFSGRDSDGPQRNDAGHAHAFFLPEDADGDGLIDHLIVYCRLGFSVEGRRRLDRLTRLWLAHGRADEEGNRGRKEWRVALEDIAAPEKLAATSSLLKSSRKWKSITPYLMPWHAKRNFGVVEQIARETERRGIFPTLVDVAVLDQNTLSKRPIRFHRIRSRRGLVQPDTLGSFVSLTFAQPVTGPLSLGFACHYGLGLFAVVDERIHDDL
jgi:CRISPR-associated protein Csb2